MSIQIDLLKKTPLKLGDGLNWATGDLRQSALTDFEETPSDGSAARKNKFRTALVENFSDFSKAVSTEARASLGIGVFSASGGVSATLLARTSSYSIRIAVVVEVELSIIQLKRPNSTVNITDIDAFVATHGTHFIIARQRGASLVAVLSVAAQSAEERSSLSSQIQASGLIGSFDIGASGSYAQRLESITGNRSISIEVDKEGGDFQISTNDWRAFLTQVTAFENSVNEENAYNRRIWIEGYEYAKGIDGIIGQSIRERVLEQQFRLDRLARMIQKRTAVQQVIANVETNPRRFSEGDQARCSAIKEEVDDSLINLLQEVQRVKNNPSYDPFIPDFPAFVVPIDLQPALPPEPLAQALDAPKVICYTGPSRTGRKFEFLAPGGDFPLELNDKMRSFEIVGNLGTNKWWITFCLNAGGDWGIQTFASPIVSHVINETVSEYNIDLGVVEKRKLPEIMVLASSIIIARNLDDTKRPPIRLNRGEAQEKAQSNSFPTGGFSP